MSEPSKAMIAVRNAANWCNLSTPLGLAVAAVGGARIRRGRRGTIICDGYRWRFPIGGAYTLGSVITTHAPSFDDLEAHNPGLFEHEEAHTWQFAYSLGLVYLPIYCAMMGWSWLVTGDKASANLYERGAGLREGGYVEHPRRPVGAGVRAVARTAERLVDEARRAWCLSRPA